jgi:hypothetical protein
VLGLWPTLRLAYAAGALVLAPLLVFIVAPYLTGDFSTASFTWGLGEAGQARRRPRRSPRWSRSCWSSARRASP